MQRKQEKGLHVSHGMASFIYIGHELNAVFPTIARLVVPEIWATLHRSKKVKRFSPSITKCSLDFYRIFGPPEPQ